MGKTYRDIREAKRRQYVEQQDPYHYPNSQTPRDVLMTLARLEHVCSPYCLIHWAKRVDRRKARLADKRWLREEHWRDDERAG